MSPNLSAVDIEALTLWTFIDEKELLRSIDHGDAFFVLLLLSDCPACHQALLSIDVAKVQALGVKAYAFVAQEMNPEAIKSLTALRVAIAPEGRFYANGRVISAWQSITPGASNEDIDRFVESWLRKTLETSQSPTVSNV